jgi:hypothetical protein
MIIDARTKKACTARQFPKVRRSPLLFERTRLARELTRSHQMVLIEPSLTDHDTLHVFLPPTASSSSEPTSFDLPLSPDLDGWESFVSLSLSHDLEHSSSVDVTPFFLQPDQPRRPEPLGPFAFRNLASFGPRGERQALGALWSTGPDRTEVWGWSSSWKEGAE